jgi:nucleoside-diphosphate-sugar epimerase
VNALHVVLGGTGGVGAALVGELAARDLAVRAVSRSGRAVVEGVDAIAADVRDCRALRTAVRGAAVVYHAAQPSYTRWPEEFPALTRAVVDATAAMGAKLVMVDNLYAYGPVDGGYGLDTAAGLLREDTPIRATGRKGRVRAEMAAALLRAHDRGRLPVTIGRLADYHGPGGLRSSVGAQLFRAALRDRPAPWFGGADQPHSFTFLPDAARALVTLGRRPEADGRVWHLPVAEPVTPREFVGLVYATAGSRPRLRAVPAWMLRAAGVVVPLARELAELGYQVDRPFVVDDGLYAAAFGDVTATAHRDAVKATLGWFAARPSASVGA